MPKIPAVRIRHSLQVCSLAALQFGLASCSTTSTRTPASEMSTINDDAIIDDPPSSHLSKITRGSGAIRKTLVTQGESQPKGEMSVSIDLDQLSRDMGIPRARLEREGHTLAAYLEGRKPRTNCASDDADEDESRLCDMFDRLGENSRARSLFSAIAGGRRVPVRPQFFHTQQAMGYSRLLKSIGREPVARVMAWVPQLLATTACPRNLSAAALRRLENGLPAANIRKSMELLYDHSVACLKPDDDGYETTHFRQALLRFMWGDREGAKASINRAAIATNSDEKSRVLYWAGALQSSTALQKKYWGKLVDDYPLSFHALEVWHHWNVDPLEIFAQRPALDLNRKVISQNDEVQESLRWLETLYVIGRVDAAQKLARWMSRSYKEELSPSNLLYISALRSKRGTPLNSITFLTRQISENPDILNKQTLRMLFPRPYFDVFDRNSPNTDTYLLLSVARQESGFNPRARSRANARGLLQLLPGTARVLSGKRRNDLYDTELNARLGAKFLSNLIDKFDNVELALAAYNAGPGRIPEWRGRYPTTDLSLFLDLIPFKETRGYVTNIVRNNYWYERLYKEENQAGTREPSSLKTQKSNLVTKLVASHRANKVAVADAAKVVDDTVVPAAELEGATSPGAL